MLNQHFRSIQIGKLCNAAICLNVFLQHVNYVFCVMGVREKKKKKPVISYLNIALPVRVRVYYSNRRLYTAKGIRLATSKCV